MSEKSRKLANRGFDGDSASQQHDAGSVNAAVGAASSRLLGLTTTSPSTDRAAIWLREALGLPEEDTPFPWQQELLARFSEGKIERSLDIPTGLGKTAVMAIWLVARAHGAALPRRLVYVVDRRAVVDQATDVATGLRKYADSNAEFRRALNLGDRSLPISTLRGQHVDNREWLEDPASPAIIVGTIDMIGSRLLFEGYGTSRKMRPYHAGLLGADTLLVLDEAHLVPPFEKLLEAIADGGAVFGARDEVPRELVPPFKLVTLSATGRKRTDKPFGLTDADLKPGSVSRKRLDAPKRLSTHLLKDEIKLTDALAKQAWEISGNGARGVRCIVFCHKRKDAEDTKEAIEKLAKGDKKRGTPEVKVDTELFVGGRRVLEREEAAKRLKKVGFIAGAKVMPIRAAFLFATSAGEVGVDLDADHMVSDLVAWERMVQRLGRVNRRGDGDANVIVVSQPQQKPEKVLSKIPSNRTKKESEVVADYEKWVARSRVLDCLPRKHGAIDASPGAIRSLKLSAEANPELQAILDAATTPAPLRPALSRALVEAWSMTSLKKHAGRPEIAPWLRGWVNEDPRTAVVWRKHLPVRTRGNAATNKEIEAYFEAAPPHASERLETETYHVVKWLADRAKTILRASNGQTSTEPAEEVGSETSHFRKGDVAAVALSPAGDVLAVPKLEDFVFESDDKKANKRKKELLRNLAGATLVVDARIAGLYRDGLLDHKAEDPPRTADDGKSWLSTADNEPVVRFQVRVADADSEQFPDVELRWKERLRFATQIPEDREPSHWLIVEKWLHDAATEDDRSAGHPQLLDTHRRWAERRAHELAGRLGLPEGYTDMLAIAARLHDEGKRAKRWQRAFNAPTDGDYAKTLGPINQARLDGYRHEFGSLKVAAKDDDLLKLPDDPQDLALHLIAAHHGFARPVISVNGCEDAPPAALEERARDVALRFARLQKRWGPWGLAWWEALLRASDEQASRDNDAADSAPAKESV